MTISSVSDWPLSAPMQVRGACPHDCPDTCALPATVDNGVATHKSTACSACAPWPACPRDEATVWRLLREGQARLHVAGGCRTGPGRGRSAHRGPAHLPPDRAHHRQARDKQGNHLLLAQYTLEGWSTSLPQSITPAQIIGLYCQHGTHEPFHSGFKTDMGQHGALTSDCEPSRQHQPPRAAIAAGAALHAACRTLFVECPGGRCGDVHARHNGQRRVLDAYRQAIRATKFRKSSEAWIRYGVVTD